MSAFRFLVALLILVLPAPALADEVRENPKAVVELFTSQGCASCPPADALLNELAENDDIIALAFHVDYWDYIGWSDTFGTADNSDRQRAYATRRGSSRVYTPQIIINGTRDVVGSREGDVHAALSQAQLDLPVDLEIVDDVLTIDIPSRSGFDKAMVWLVTYLDEAEVAIERGENRGKSLVYTQVVTGLQPMGVWEPEEGALVRMPIADVLSDSDGVAVLVQQHHEGLPGPIIGAGLFEL